MSRSPKLGLPYLEMSQAQKEITHNEALLRLDALVQARALERRDVPPGDPEEGDLYIVGAAPSGAWSDHEGKLAAWYGGWVFLAPQPGWSLLEAASGRRLTFDGSAWQAVPPVQIPSLGNGWINYGGGYAGVRYFRDERGRVTIEGMMQAGSDGVVFTLLEGFRPAETLIFCCWSGGGPYRVDVRANGEVEVQASNAVFSSLAGVSFTAAA